MNDKSIILIIILLLIALVTYIALDTGEEYLQEQKQSYYEAGQQQGVLYWNNKIIQTFENENKVPYIWNNTIQKVNLIEWCGSLNDN